MMYNNDFNYPCNILPELLSVDTNFIMAVRKKYHFSIYCVLFIVERYNVIKCNGLL